MKRRDFITLLGGAAAWPLAARAQQPAMAEKITDRLWEIGDIVDVLEAWEHGNREYRAS